MERLRKSEKPGFTELNHCCIDSMVTKPQTDLLAIAEQSSIHTFGWPIGVVLRNRDNFRPRPTNDGIVAQLDTGHDYDYWALTRNGDFYILISLFEDDRTRGELYLDTRIIRTTEAILHCLNIYKAFGVEPSASVVLTITHGGLKGRVLTRRLPESAHS